MFGAKKSNTIIDSTRTLDSVGIVSNYVTPYVTDLTWIVQKQLKVEQNISRANSELSWPHSGKPLESSEIYNF